jgi:ABC transport system ATP-binding/permease protein
MQHSSMQPPMVAPVLSLEDSLVLVGAEPLFAGLDLHIGPRDRFALIGRNGAGKSTLMRLLAGTQEVDGGVRRLNPGVSVVHLEQEPDVARYASLADFALSDVVLGDGTVLPGAERHQVEALASELDLDLARSAANASGGERRRAALIRALALEPSVLLLDEPTNHLDLAAIEWLEGKLQSYAGAFLIISHDRTFLTQLTRSMLWLEQGSLRRKDIGFGGFEEWQEQIFNEYERAQEKLDSKLKMELHWLQRGVTARRKRNQGRLAKLNDMRVARKAMLGQGGTAKLALEDDRQQSKVVIDADTISKTYGERVIVKPLNLRIVRGDRIGIIGRNGAGKTTLLRMLTGELAPDTGRVRIAKTIDMVNIDQQRSLLVAGRSVKEILSGGSDWIDVRGERKHIAGYLKEFLFDPKLADVPIETLSGGERARILLAREFARKSSLLVLDEPTNDLDLETLDLLQEVIADYEGTVLIVSHDRDFLDRTVNMVLGMDGSGTVDIVAGGYSDWQAKRKPEQVAKTLPKKTEPATSSAPKKQTKLSYKDQRDFDQFPADIARLEARITELEDMLGDATLYTRDPSRFAKLNDEMSVVRSDANAKEERWLELAELAESLG